MSTETGINYYFIRRLANFALLVLCELSSEGLNFPSGTGAMPVSKMIIQNQNE